MFRFPRHKNSLRVGFFIFALISISVSSLGAAGATSRIRDLGPIVHPDQTPASYIVVDATKGTILSSKKMHESVNVASTSKIITALAAINALHQDQPVTIPVEAQNVEPMRIDMNAGEQWKRDDLLYSLLMVSANDAAYALADASAGSITKFADLEDDLAKQLGMKNSHFGDPSGLDDSSAINGDTKMSAYDLAIGARAVLAQPLLAQIVSTTNYQFVGGDAVMHTLTSHNDKFLSGYSGANGMKTGYTKKAGRTQIASATRNGTTLIAVVLNVQETDQWSAQLLDAGFNSMTTGSVAKNATTLPAIGVVASKSNLTILKDPPKASESAAVTTGTDSSWANKLLSVPVISFIIIAGLATAFVLRRRAVMKRKKLRRLRAQQMRDTKRREMFDLIEPSRDLSPELVTQS